MRHKLQDCTDGVAPTSSAPSKGPTPAPGSPPAPVGPVTGKSPALAWTSVPGKNPNAQEGLEVIKHIAAAGVIDAFMDKYPELKAIMWGEPYTTKGAVDLALEHAKKLCKNTDIASYMKSHGFVPSKYTMKKDTIWEKHGSANLFGKKTNDWKENGGPNNGFMRVFFQDLFSKLHEFNGDYGWSNGLWDGLFDGRTLTLVGYSINGTSVPAAASPRTWVLPQMHYLGVLPLDLHHGNFGLVPGYDKGVPVDLDGTWRGQTSAFMKVNPASENIGFMEREYHGIDGILA